MGKGSRGLASQCLAGFLLTSLGRISEEQPEVMYSDLRQNVPVWQANREILFSAVASELRKMLLPLL